MPIEAVIDSSVITAMVTPEEHSDWASQKLSEGEYLHVLDLNYYEVANAIKHKISDKFASDDAVNSLAKAIELMNLYTVHNFSEIIDNAMTIALELNITVYDAAFLSLANNLNMRFLTLDTKLEKRLDRTKYARLIECP